MLTLNADLGECDRLAPNNTEYQLMPHLDMANIACGFHAGNRQVMRNTIALATEHRVAVGAHPSYPDREGFGRQSFALSRANICDLVLQQISLMEALCEDQHVAMNHVKPHGALYNDMMQSDEVLLGIFDAIQHLDNPVPLLLMATPHNALFRQKAQKSGIEVMFEAFADRRYNDQGMLQNRSLEGAVLHEEAAIVQQAQYIANGQPLTTAGGRALIIEAQTLCVHGDNPQAVNAVAAIRNMLGSCR